ncbi:MAG TPA: hypothetical protein VIC35_07565 [Acidimicrobiia bacterium]|jgi:hypothetical protein
MTDEFEDQLRGALHASANSVAVGEDRLDELMERERRQRRTRRTVTAVAVAFAVIALPAAGFAFGRVTAPSSSSNKATAPNGSASVSGPTGGATGSTPAGPGGAKLDPLITPEGGALDHLFTRTTSTGVTVRAYIARGMTCAQTHTACPSGPAAYFRAASCFTSMIQAELSTREAVAIGSSTTVAQGGSAGSQPRVAGVGTFGIREGAPASWVIVQGGNAARVRARFSAGSTDEMAPVDGVAVLASRVSNANGPVSVDTIDSHGNVTPGPSVPAGTIIIGSSASVAGACPAIPAPPLTLPAPGVQPSNPTAARAAIEHAYELVYDGRSADSAKADALEDSRVTLPLLIAAANGPDAATVKAASARVLGVVFTSPTSATVRYEIMMHGAPDIGEVGSAVYVDGAWRVARQTICDDLQLVGQSCPARR